MKTPRSFLVVSLVFIGLAFCNTSFAECDDKQDDIFVSPWLLEYQKDLSTAACAQVQIQFTAVSDYLNGLKVTEPLTPEQVALVDDMLARVQTRMSQLNHIAVYVAEELPPNIPGDAFTDVYNHFSPTYTLKVLQDATGKIQKADEESETLINKSMEQAISELPEGTLPISQEVRNTLRGLIQDGKVSIATGSSNTTSPKTRISIMTVYLVPDGSTSPTYLIEEGTAVVIATDN